MKNVLLKAVLSLSFLGILWYGLSLVDFRQAFEVESTNDTTEKLLGELIEKSMTQGALDLPEIVSPVDSIVHRICRFNSLDRSYIKVHIIDSEAVNAFALPDGHIIINSGLLANTNQTQASGVIAHEIAHITQGHVMKKLVTEIGLSVIISLVTGDTNPQLLKEIIKAISGSAYSRNLETEADLLAVDYLIAAGISPLEFADFLYTIDGNQIESNQLLEWLQSHPDSKERAKAIVAYSNEKESEKLSHTPVVSKEDWEILQSKLP